MNMFARFDENPAMTLQDIKETKRYGRTDARTDNVKTVYPPQTKFVEGIKKHICVLFQRVVIEQLSQSIVLIISLLSHINKVLGRIVFKHLYNHFHKNDILTPLQSGFILGNSTVN